MKLNDVGKTCNFCQDVPNKDIFAFSNCKWLIMMSQIFLFILFLFLHLLWKGKGFICKNTWAKKKINTELNLILHIVLFILWVATFCFYWKYVAVEICSKQLNIFMPVCIWVCVSALWMKMRKCYTSVNINKVVRLFIKALLDIFNSIGWFVLHLRGTCIINVYPCAGKHLKNSSIIYTKTKHDAEVKTNCCASFWRIYHSIIS